VAARNGVHGKLELGVYLLNKVDRGITILRQTLAQFQNDHWTALTDYSEVNAAPLRERNGEAHEQDPRPQTKGRSTHALIKQSQKTLLSRSQPQRINNSVLELSRAGHDNWEVLIRAAATARRIPSVQASQLSWAIGCSLPNTRPKNVLIWPSHLFKDCQSNTDIFVSAILTG
jgi:hypothetical protein